MIGTGIMKNQSTKYIKAIQTKPISEYITTLMFIILTLGINWLNSFLKGKIIVRVCQEVRQ